MTREELSKEIAKRIKEIRELYYSVYPKGNYLAFFFKKDCISFNNENWEGAKDEDFSIDYFEDEEFIRINENKEKKC